MNVGILVFDDVEVLDACGPFEVFSVAQRLISRAGQDRPLDVALINATPERTEVIARGGLRLGTRADIGHGDTWDVLIVAGGVTDAVEKNSAVIGWLRSQDRPDVVIGSVCTGAFLLAAAGIISRGEVTTHWEDQDELARRYPRLTVTDGVRWSRQGNRYTSAGISAGLDLSLQLVADTISDDLALRTARQMDYHWQTQRRQ